MTAYSISWSALGGDPAPGDQGAIGQQVAQFREVADNTAEAIRGMLGVASSAWKWTGVGAGRYDELVSPVQPQLQKLFQAHSAGAAVIRQYLFGLADRQRRADELLASAARTTDALASAKQALARAHDQEAAQSQSVRRAREQLAEDMLRRATLLATMQSTAALDEQIRRVQHASWQAEADHESALRARLDADSRVAAANDALRQIHREVDALRAESLRDAKVVATAILALVGLQPHSANAIVRAIQESPDAVHEFATGDFLPAFLDELDHVMNWLSVATLFVSWVPVVGEVTAGVLLVLSVVSLAGHVLRAANGAESWSAAASSGLMLLVNKVAPGVSKLGTNKATFVSATKRGVSYHDYQGGLGYLKQGLRYGRAGGSWPTILGGKFMEQHVVAVPKFADKPVPNKALARGFMIVLGGVQIEQNVVSDVGRVQAVVGDVSRAISGDK